MAVPLVHLLQPEPPREIFQESSRSPSAEVATPSFHYYAPWHFLYFFPDPHGQGSLRPTFSSPRTTCCTCWVSPAPAMRACSSSRRLRRMKASSSSSADVDTILGRRPFPSPARCVGLGCDSSRAGAG